MAQTVCFCLSGCFYFISYLHTNDEFNCVKNIKHNPQHFSERMMAFLERIYMIRLIQALHNQKKIIIATFVAFIVAIVVLSQLGGEFIPALEEGDFAVETRVLTGSNLNTTISSTQKLQVYLRQSFLK